MPDGTREKPRIPHHTLPRAIKTSKLFEEYSTYSIMQQVLSRRGGLYACLRVPRRLRVKQVFLPHTAKLLQFLLLPFVRQASRVTPLPDSFQNRSRAHQRERLLQLKLVGKQFEKRGGEFNAQFPRVERLTVEQNDLNSVAGF